MTNNPSQALRFISAHIEYFVLGSLILLVTVSNILWLQIDNRPVDNRDSTVFLSRTINLIDKIKAPDISPSLRDITGVATAGRPPLFQWLGIPFLELFGYNIDAFLYTNLIFYVLLIIATFNIGKLSHGKNAGMLAAVLVSLYPSVIRLSKVLLTNFALIASTALTVWLLLKFMQSRSTRDAWAVNLSLAFGFLIHPSFLWGAPIPAAMIILGMVFFSSEPKWVTRINELPAWVIGKLRAPLLLHGILPSAIISIALILLWYLSYGSILLDVISGVGTYVTDDPLGKFFLGPTLDLPSGFIILWFALTFGFAISTGLAIFFGASVVGALISRKQVLLSLLFIFVSAYLVHFQQLIGLSWRYFAQILPVAAALTGAWVFSLKNNRIMMLLASACVVVSLFNYSIVSWGAFNPTGMIGTAIGLTNSLDTTTSSGEPLDTILIEECRPSFALFCPDPPRAQEWPMLDFLKEVFDAPECAAGECDLLLITGPNYLYQGTVFYTSIDYRDRELDLILFSATIEGESFFNFSGLLESEFIVYNDAVRLLSAENYDPYIPPAAYQFFESLPPLFAESHQVVDEYEVPDGSHIVLYQRVKPLTRAEAEETILAIELPQSIEALKHRVFIDLAVDSGDLANALTLYQAAIDEVGDPELLKEIRGGLISAYLAKAESFLSDQPQEALTMYELILDIDANNLDAHTALMIYYREQGECKNAAGHASARVQIDESSKTYTDLGEVYRRCSDFTKADEAYRMAITIDPGDGRAHFALALSLASQGMATEAHQEFLIVIALEPSSSLASRAQAWIDSNIVGN